MESACDLPIWKSRTHVVAVFLPEGVSDAERCCSRRAGDYRHSPRKDTLAVLGVDGGTEAAGVNLEFAAPSVRMSEMGKAESPSCKLGGGAGTAAYILVTSTTWVR